MSKIEWTERAWNPIVGCSVVSPGCTNCYAMRMAGRLQAMGQERYADLTRRTKAGFVWTGRMRPVPSALTIPLRRRTPTTYFVNSMSDLFHQGVADAEIDRVFAVMALCPQHTFQVLTKRAERMRAYLTDPSFGLRIGGELMKAARGHVGAECHVVDLTHRLTVQRQPLPNVWLGVSTEDQTRANERVPELMRTPAAVRFVSAEPLLGPIDFTNIRPADCAELDAISGFDFDQGTACEALDWIIVGGESGRGARAMHPDWVRAIRDQCAVRGRPWAVPFFLKQWGAWAPEAIGREWMILDRDGGLDIPDGRWPDEEAGEVAVTRVGKKAAGRLLDGVEHGAMPQAAHA